MPEPIQIYGAVWPAEATELQIEMACIRKGGTWHDKEGRECGLGLSHHFEEMRRIIWPELETHRWHELCRDEILRSKVTVLMGPASSGKTHEAAWIKLCEYWVHPEQTLVLVSSTDIRGLRLRVWAEIVMLWEKGRERFPFLAGHLIDSKMAIATDELSEDKARDLRKGIIGIPCIQNGRYVGLGKYAGIKQGRIHLVADEAQFMGTAFLSAFAGLDKGSYFNAVVLGNPNDILDPLGKAAEPRDGWTNHLEPEKTSVWDTKFMNGRCVNLVGTDSPNFDYPPDQPTRFPFLISGQKIANTLSFFPKDSIEYYSTCVGVMKIGTLAKRVITRDMCVQFHASEGIIWKGTPTTKIGALDAAYGGDRCVFLSVEFGLDIHGQLLLHISPPQIVPIRIATGVEPEDQIAEWVRNTCDSHGIAPENFFHDSTGRGSLGTALARIWSAQTNPVEFGGEPSERPVCLDLYVFDPVLKQRRLKLCKEHYSKFVTELWFSVRYAIEAGQIRGLPEDVMEEGCMRQWERVSRDRIEVEPKSGRVLSSGVKRVGMKERTGRSPDLFDCLAIAVEGARRRGFTISKLANQSSESDNLVWLEALRLANKERVARYTLNHAA